MNTMYLRKALALTVSCLVVALAGCASTPAPKLLTLPPAVAASAGSPPASSSTEPRPVLAVGRIDVPEYVVSRRVRYRTDESTLAEWPDTYWAERIEVSLAREFLAALRHDLPAWSICEANCAERSPAVALRMVIDRMDYARADRRLNASVRIVLRSTGRAQEVLYDEVRAYVIAAASDDAQSQAWAYAELLRSVAADASGLLAKVPARQSSAPSAEAERPGAR